MKSSAEDVTGAGVDVVEDLGVPGFPELPKDDENDVHPKNFREAGAQTNQPGGAKVASLNVEGQFIPDVCSQRPRNKDVPICF